MASAGPSDLAQAAAMTASLGRRHGGISGRGVLAEPSSQSLRTATGSEGRDTTIRTANRAAATVRGMAAGVTTSDACGLGRAAVSGDARLNGRYAWSTRRPCIVASARCMAP